MPRPRSPRPTHVRFIISGKVVDSVSKAGHFDLLCLDVVNGCTSAAWYLCSRRSRGYSTIRQATKSLTDSPISSLSATGSMA